MENRYPSRGRAHIRALAHAFLHTQDILRMSANGVGIEAIGNALQVNPRLVSRVLANAAAPDPQVAGSLPWHPEQDKILLRMRNREGRMWIPIADALDRPVGEVMERHKYLTAVTRRRTIWSTRSVEQCMTCHTSFVKEGRWNRRCPACKAADNGLPDHYTLDSSGSDLRRFSQA
jgi:hypothetical protein